MFMIILFDFALMDSVQCIIMMNIPLFQGKFKLKIYAASFYQGFLERQGKGREFKLYRLDPSGKFDIHTFCLWKMP